MKIVTSGDKFKAILESTLVLLRTEGLEVARTYLVEAMQTISLEENETGVNRNAKRKAPSSAGSKATHP